MVTLGFSPALESPKQEDPQSSLSANIQGVVSCPLQGRTEEFGGILTLNIIALFLVG